MAPNLITMLTHHDTTVDNAAETFRECSDLPCAHWGFKDIGLEPAGMRNLVDLIKGAGKTCFLEVVSLTEEECMAGARLAVELGIDYLMGTLFYPSVFDFLGSHSISYFPFCGKVSGHPSVLGGDIEETVREGRKLAEMGVQGFDLLAYRYQGDALELAKAFVNGVDLPVVIAGSIGSTERVDVMKSLNPWGFTIGSAFFEESFVPGAGFRNQLKVVLEQLAGEESRDESD